MKTRGGWSETSTHKHTGTANGDPIEVEVVTVRERLTPELLASLPPEQLAAFLKRTSDRELEAIEHDWGWWGRPNQPAKLPRLFCRA